jgi:hypothetical protein
MRRSTATTSFTISNASTRRRHFQPQAPITNLAWTLLGAVAVSVLGADAPPPPIVLENTHVRYVVSADGKNLEFIDHATGLDYLRRDPPSSCALVRRSGKEYPATSASLKDGRLGLRFGESGVEAVLRVEARASYIRFTVDSLAGGEVDTLIFLNIPLTLQGRPEDPFGACAFSLNLQTRVDALPALQTDLQASCYKKFGLVGAKAALVGMTMDKMLPALQEVLTEADEMPHCRVAGPWAPQVPFNHGSYLFNFGALTEATVEDWIGMAKGLGVNQIDNHGGSAFFRFGDFALNREKWPEGWDTYRRIVQRLHEAGIGSIFHTYAFFIDKQSKYVTPVPDRRLDAFRTFTLAEAIGSEAAEMVVNESTKGLSTVTGFFEHNSVVLHLGDELITFGGVSQEPPWRFTGLKRGAFGTRPAPHEKGAQARHLKECFGLFVPDVESSLFEEIARNHAEIINACGFNGIYLDAIDGSSILRGPEECWYWADKFVFAIQRDLKKPVGMEMSAMWHHSWQFRTRYQAWDYPQRGHKRFIDLHAASVHGGLLLPLHLGWWNFQSWNPPQVEPTYPDVIEYLGAKLIGWDAGISLAGAIDQERLNAVPLFRRAVDILRTCEELRHGGSVNEAVRARLREPGKEFSLIQDETGAWQFIPVHFTPHTVALAEPWSLSWTAENPFGEQPVHLRFEILMSAGSYDEPGNIVLLNPAEAGTFPTSPQVASGVQAKLDAAPAASAVPAAAWLTATNSSRVARPAAWARWDRKFDPCLNLKNHQALGLWVEGDGLGELIAVRLESPRHLAFGAVADHYLTVDFTGPRLITLVETESTRWNDYVWNDGKGLYNLYRETIDFAVVESVGVWCHNIPPNQAVRPRLGPVKAIPMLASTARNPTLQINGQTVVFPVAIESGGFLEWDGRDDATRFGSKGESLGPVIPRGQPPQLRPGKNELRFSCDRVDGPAPRVKVVLMPQGQPLRIKP